MPTPVLEPTQRALPQWSLPPRRRLVLSPSVSLLVILAAQLMVVLDATIVNVALPHIQSSLGFTSTSLSWVLNAYILTFGGLLMLGARSGDLLGRRRIFIGGIVLFSLASLVGGLATTTWMLLGARAAQGVGGALAAPSALALLTTLFPEGAARIRAIALFTTVSAAGGAIGLVAGGMLTEWVGWRWVMFVNVPIGLVVSLLARKAIAETPVRRGHFDAAGALTSTLGMTGLVLGLVQAGSDGWASPITIGSLVSAAVLLAAFVAAEQRATEPVLPLRLLTHPTRTAANAARGLVYSGMYGMFFFLSQFLQEIQGYSPLRAGVSFLPMPISVFLSSQLTSRVLVRRRGPAGASGVSAAPCVPFPFSWPAPLRFPLPLVAWAASWSGSTPVARKIRSMMSAFFERGRGASDIAAAMAWSSSRSLRSRIERSSCSPAIGSTPALQFIRVRIEAGRHPDRRSAPPCITFVYRRAHRGGGRVRLEAAAGTRDHPPSPPGGSGVVGRTPDDFEDLPAAQRA